MEARAAAVVRDALDDASQEAMSALKAFAAEPGGAAPPGPRAGAAAPPSPAPSAGAELARGPGGTPAPGERAPVAGEPEPSAAGGSDGQPPPMITARGRFVDALGRPLAGVRVRAQGLEVSAESALDGRFELPFPAGDTRRAVTLELRAELAGFLPRTLEPEVPAEPPPDGFIELGDVLLAAAGRVAGRVTDRAGVAVPAAQVVCTHRVPLPVGPLGQEPRERLTEARCDGRGEFELDGVPLGDVRIWAGAEGMHWAFAELHVEAGEVGRVELQLEREEREDAIELVVLDPAGLPVPHAQVGYRYELTGRSGSGNVQADEHGRHRQEVSFRATYDFSAADPEGRYRPATARGIEPGTRDLVLQLGEPALLEVAALGADRAPLAGFRVQVRLVGADPELWLEPVTGGDPAEPEAAPEPLQLALPSEAFELEVQADGHQSARLGPLEPETVDPRVEVLLTPLPGVRGRVVDGEGEPVPGAAVSLHAVLAEGETLTVNGFRSRSQKGAGARALAGEDGHFQLTLRRPGRFHLRAEAAGLAPGELGPLELLPEVGASDLFLVLGPGGAIEGRVHPRPGESASGVIVGLSRGDGFGFTTRSDEVGRYRAEGLTPGRWFVQRREDEIAEGTTSSSSGSTEGEWEIPWNCEVWEGQTTRHDLFLELTGQVVLEGRLAFSGGAPVGWTVSLERFDPREDIGEDVLDSQGRFRFELDEPGRYELVLHGMWQEPPFFWLRQEVELQPGVNEWSEDLPSGAVTATGPPPPAGESRRLQYRWARADDLSLSCSIEVGADGGFTLARVPAGPSELHDATAGEWVLLEELEVHAGAVTELVLP